MDHLKYWAERKIDWKTAYFDTWSHPHRQLILDALKRFKFGSILEIGCASGPNLYNISRAYPHLIGQISGIDPSEDALKTAVQVMPWLNNRVFRGMAEHIFFSDKSVDMVLTDMSLIYVKDIDKALKEIKRVARKGVVLCEFNHRSWLKRLKLKFSSGYYARDYEKLLENNGFYDIIIEKIPEESWPGGNPQKTFGYIITARL